MFTVCLWEVLIIFLRSEGRLPQHSPGAGWGGGWGALASMFLEVAPGLLVTR